VGKPAFLCVTVENKNETGLVVETQHAGSLHGYSVLRALIGEIDAARPAGMMAAKNAQIASEIAATLSASGSQNETP